MNGEHPSLVDCLCLRLPVSPSTQDLDLFPQVYQGVSEDNMYVCGYVTRVVCALNDMHL